LLLPLFFSYGLFFNTFDFTYSFLRFSQSCTPVIIRDSSLLLTATHGFLPALSWPMTGRTKICVAALEVLQPLEDFSQNEKRAFLDPPFFAAVLFVTLNNAKHNVHLLLRFQNFLDLHNRLHLAS
jgi:hypothetical protein